VPLVVYLRTKFEVYSFNHSRDMEGSQNFKSRLRNPFTIPFDVILHFFDSAACTELSVKFNANIFFGDRYMAILLLCQFGCEMPIPTNLGDIFGGFDPRNVVRYPKRHILGRKHVFWRIDRVDWSRNAT